MSFPFYCRGQSGPGSCNHLSRWLRLRPFLENPAAFAPSPLGTVSSVTGLPVSSPSRGFAPETRLSSLLGRGRNSGGNSAQVLLPPGSPPALSNCFDNNASSFSDCRPRLQGPPCVGDRGHVTQLSRPCPGPELPGTPLSSEIWICFRDQLLSPVPLPFLLLSTALTPSNVDFTPS